MMQPVDYDTWPRREVLDFFSGVSNPFYNVTFKVDVTRLYAFTKARHISFYYALVYLATKAVNSVENFRYALNQGKLVLLDRRLPSFTDLHPGSEIFHIVNMPCEGTLEEFCRAAAEKSRTQTTLFSQEDSPDLIYFSCLPWVELTALTNERDFDPDDTVPRITWGKYTVEGTCRVLHMSLEVNHRFIDGLHIGRFCEALTASIQALEY